MATLHIEHPVRSFDMWRSAFDGFAEARHRAGVRRAHIQRPIDDPAFVVVDLEFDTTDQAELFLTFLQTQVWSSSAASPALIGTPRTAILQSVLTT